WRRGAAARRLRSRDRAAAARLAPSRARSRRLAVPLPARAARPVLRTRRLSASSSATPHGCVQIVGLRIPVGFQAARPLHRRSRSCVSPVARQFCQLEPGLLAELAHQAPPERLVLANSAAAPAQAQPHREKPPLHV